MKSVNRVLSSALVVLITAGHAVAQDVPAFWVRPGYKVTLAAKDLAESRFMVFDDRGTLYVSQPGPGAIVALRDTDNDGMYETSTPFVTGMKTVHGLDCRDGWIWFTTSGGVYKTQDADADGKADNVVTVIDNLVSGGGHWWRSICVVADGFFTSIGDSGNINDESATDRQKIWKYSLDGQNRRLWSDGIRNTEKLRLRPGTDELWGADHGSDNYGRPFGETRGNQPITDLNPPCEFNHYVEGGFYGHPFIMGNRVPRLEFKDRKDIVDLAAKTIPPAFTSGAHWANNGFCFLETDYFPDHRGDALIAFHGSWNSSVKVGYQVHRVTFDEVTGKPFGGLTVVSTLSADGSKVLGRPCDVVEAPDGTVLFTCSSTKRIYRISRAD
jgi:glucose/arabinose dehydrogenase